MGAQDPQDSQTYQDHHAKEGGSANYSQSYSQNLVNISNIRVNDPQNMAEPAHLQNDLE